MAQTVTSGTSPEGPRPSYMYKVVLLGSMSVGKSSLACRYVRNDFRELLPTVGCSFFTQTLDLEDATVKFEIWDTAGQEKYHSVCHLYYRDAHAALIVYDIANKQTFSRAKLWLEELEKRFLPDEIVIALVGNKTDLAAEREVTTEEAEEFAQTKGLLFKETSAKSNYQVTDVFMAVGAPEEGKGECIQAIPTWEVDRGPEWERGEAEVLQELRTLHPAGLDSVTQQGHSELQAQLSLATSLLKASSEPILGTWGLFNP
ncbi:ras-related protein Rab-17 isoform X1 [Oenanthe melanoleuca]|uniref:ras-related protein Rab-17 isoform X1 n=1 Tax=Oenanthe melanoleuca TaxID=2939378 RepID=UPI0024C16E49|nr:ras-related protein Rab-17 isoform X1 [Oenanthe melanoleuca]XP_056352770.1 ras-related protein Rab-17 isoform X1 [Oenanthe melanoleuca]XP_056352771.1 ras-related protein Rab-17 isoform X1 [Oenanthe melanoleuca]